MKPFNIVFTRRFSMAHRLIEGCSVKCATPHGHNEYVKVTLACMTHALNGTSNMPASFEQLKKTWHQFIDNRIDHAFQLNVRDPLIGYFQEFEPEKLDRLVVTPGDPTTEMLCALLARKLEAYIMAEDLPVQLVELTIEETPTNTVTYKMDNGTHYMGATQDGAGAAHWWQRPDMDINDLRCKKQLALTL